MRYLIVAEAYRDLERLSSRLALTERLAALVADTPAGLLPTVCYLCQGLIAPEWAGVDLGLAEKLAVRAVAAVVGADAAEVAALVREAAVAIGFVLGLLYLFPIVSSVASNPRWQRHLEQIGPMTAGLCIQVTVGVQALPLSPWQGLGVLAAWAFGALLLGALALCLRDA